MACGETENGWEARKKKKRGWLAVNSNNIFSGPPYLYIPANLHGVYCATHLLELCHVTVKSNFPNGQHGQKTMDHSRAARLA